MPLPNLVRAAYLAHNQRRAEEARCSRGIARGDHAYRLPRERIATADGSLRVTDGGWEVAQLAARFPEPLRNDGQSEAECSRCGSVLMRPANMSDSAGRIPGFTAGRPPSLAQGYS